MKDRLHEFLGVAAPAAGLTVSLSAVEAWLRITSLLVGIAVGMIALRRQWNKRNK